MASQDEEKRESPAPPSGGANESPHEANPASQSCPVEMWRGNLCSRPIYRDGGIVDPRPVCLMHSQNSVNHKEQFQEEFERILAAAGDGVADFSYFAFPSVNYFDREFKAMCIFWCAKFMQGSFFGSATFTQSADFGAATFMSANFIAAKFTQGASFREARFTLDAEFCGTLFKESVDFGIATFTEGANFSGATFTGGADFTGATFTQLGFFSAATFSAIADFTEAKFLNTAVFRETKFRTDSGYEPGPIFSLAQLSHPETVFFYKTDLSQALFHNCDVSKINFSSVTWHKRPDSRKGMVLEEAVIAAGDGKNERVDLNQRYFRALIRRNGGPDEREYGLIAELYQQLKKNYDNKCDYWTAGGFHYGEMEMKRLATPPPGRTVRWPMHLGLKARSLEFRASCYLGFSKWRMKRIALEWPFTERRVNRARRIRHRHLGLVAWYKYASQYGESYWRPALCLFGVLLLFAAVYPRFGLRYDQGNALSGASAAQSSQILTYCNPLPNGEATQGPFTDRLRLYGHSVVTSVDIASFQKDRAYEPVYPYGHALALFELLLTSTLIALFLLAVRRQFRR